MEYDERIILKGGSKVLKPMITQMLVMRQMLENLDIESGGSNHTEIYPKRRFHPQIKLHFKEDTDYKKTVDNPAYQGKRRQVGSLSFRLMNETSETISKGELTRIGQTIKDLFGANGGYVWSKGKELYCYADWDKGYQLQILAHSTTQAKELVTKILSIQNHSPQWIFFTKTNNDAELERYPEVPQTTTILGKTETLARIRPRVDVRFRYAEAEVHKLIKPTILFDRTNKKVGALVT